ncbi:MAG: hypothetical protein IH594_13295, partial [Bacteroidales bacterium]|nr:hypothetical protein [Bacteroidales bacterium]
ADVLKTPVEIFRASEASSFGTFILVRSAIENTVPEEIYGALNTPRGNAVPDPRLALQYDESYDKFIRLGDLMQKYHEDKF